MDSEPRAAGSSEIDPLDHSAQQLPLSPEIESAMATARELAAASRSENTRANYRSGWNQFLRFAREHHPASSPLPANPALVALYFGLSGAEEYNLHVDCVIGPRVFRKFPRIRHDLGQLRPENAVAQEHDELVGNERAREREVNSNTLWVSIFDQLESDRISVDLNDRGVAFGRRPRHLVARGKPT